MQSASANYHNPDHPVKFNREFLERRMREHRQWQDRLASRRSFEIAKEVIGAWESYRRVRSGKGPRKIARLK